MLNPHIGHGSPTIRNKRCLVKSMLEHLAEVDTIDYLLEMFPSLEREDLLACLQYNSNSEATERFVPLR